MRCYSTSLMALIAINMLAQEPNVVLTTFSTGYQQPVDITHAGDSRLFIVEKRGVVSIADSNGNKLPLPFMNIQGRVGSGGGEQGLLGLAFHPDYKKNGYFFLNYTNLNGDTRVSRFKVTSDPNVADANSEDIVIGITQDFPNHNGGCIKFGPDGYLYIGMGDGGSGGDPNNRAQSGMTLLGKMLRLNVDVDSGYAIPSSNPYAGSLSIENEIWAFGMRNPWRFSFDKATKDLWIGDVGQGAWEEIDFEPAGGPGGVNYGWRCYEGFAPYNTNGCQPPSTYQMPVFDYDHGPLGGCSVTGGFVYRGARYQSLWGAYFFTDFCTGNWWALRDNGTGGLDTFYLGDRANNQYTSYGEDVCGELYVTNYSGAIQRLDDTTCTPVAFITMADSMVLCSNEAELEAFCGRGVDYAWQFNGVQFPGGNNRVIVPPQDGLYSVVASRDGCSDTSAQVQVSILPSPVVALIMNDTSLSITDLPVTLTGNPPGGQFSGAGVTADQFDPAAAGTGTHTITYSYTDVNGCSAADEQLVTVTPLGIDAPLDANVRVMPNPASDVIVLSFTICYSSRVELQMMDALGRTADEVIHWVPSGSTSLHLDISRLQSGVYFLQVLTDREQAGRRIVISR